MAQLESDEVPFHDASAYFSEEEWKLLQEWQRELYRNVMKEIHQALISLGPLITTTVCSLRAKEKEQVFLLDEQCSENKHRIGYSPRDTMGEPDVMFKVNNEAPVAPNHPQDPEGREGNGCTGTGFPFLNTDLSLRKEEMVSISIDPLVAEMGESSTDPNTEMARYEVVSLRIKDEDEPYFMDHQESRRIKRTFSHSGDESRNRRKKVRDSIKRNVPCKTFTEAINTMVLQSSNQETNPRCQMLPESYQEVGGKATAECESGFCSPKYFSLPQGSSAAGRSETYNESGIHLRNSPFPKALPNTEHNQSVYTCPEGEKGYRLEGGISRSMRRNSRERPYACTECEKSFFQKSHLITHNRIHSGEKPFICVFCHKRFNRKDYLYEHIRIHTGETPYKCVQCEKSFIRKKDLNYHQRKHAHNIKNIK